MSDLYLPVNIEALVVAFLADQDEIVALAPGSGDFAARVYSVIPKDATFPLVRVTQLLDRPLTGAPLWGLAFSVQVEAFGGSKAQAWTLAATARALLDTRLVGEHPGAGVVTGSTPAPMMDFPDDTFDPAKPRWLFTSTIYAHPVATIAS